MIDDLAEQWKTNGWVVAEGLVSAEEVGAALAEIRPRDEIETQITTVIPRADQPSDLGRFRVKQFDGTTLFPYPDAPQLNRLFVHPAIVDFAKAVLKTDDLRIYQARVWSKYGEHTNYEQPHHLDRNHSLVPVRQGPGWGNLECFLYLHDVSADTGAPRAVPATVAGRSGMGVGEGLGGSGTSQGPRVERTPLICTTVRSVPLDLRGRCLRIDPMCGTGVSISRLVSSAMWLRCRFGQRTCDGSTSMRKDHW